MRIRNYYSGLYLYVLKDGIDKKIRNYSTASGERSILNGVYEQRRKAVAKERQMDRTMAPDKTTITILIIDDDEIVCHMAKTILEDNLRCEVLTAHSGMDGVDMMIENEVHLVLLDVSMSGWDGFKTLSIIRDKVLLRKIPVIMLTASADRGSVIKALELGVVDYLRKPFLPEELVTRVSKVIWEYGQEESFVC